MPRGLFVPGDPVAAAGPMTGMMTSAKPRVLLISLFHPELVRGGAQQVCYELFQGLRATGTVEPFLLASVDSSCPALFKSGARITGFDGRENEFVFLSRGYDYWWHTLAEPLLVEAFIEFLGVIRPDVVHFHHFLTLGIDLVSLTRRVLPDCRIVFTFHEFMAICAADGHMIRRTDGSLCRQASPVRCHQCFPDRGPEQFLMRRLWFMRHLSAVDVFTCPSRFMIDHYVNWGIPANKIVHITNGQRSYAEAGAPPAVSARHNRFGFFGQMVDIKGVQIILRAVEMLRGEGFIDFRVEINGENLRYATPAVREEIEAFLAAERARPAAERIVSHNGGYHVDQLAQRMARVDWCIVPSIWWEIFGLVISEAWMFGRPVICSNVGGMARAGERRGGRPAFPDGGPGSAGAHDPPCLHGGWSVAAPVCRPARTAAAGADGGGIPASLQPHGNGDSGTGCGRLIGAWATRKNRRG